MHEVLRHLGHAPVHELETRRDDALCDHVRHGGAGGFHGREARQHAARELGSRHELDRHFGGDGEHAFAADDHRQQVEAGHIERFGAELDRFARRGEAAHAQHVVHGQSVLQAMHAAGILGDVAADGAGNLTARVGRVIQAERRGGLADRQVAHAALDDGRAGQRIHRQDFIESRERDRDSEAVRERAARKSRARAARHHGDSQPVTGAQRRRELFLVRRQRDDHGQHPKGRQTVAFVGLSLLAAREQDGRRQHLGQRRVHLVAPRCERRGVELRVARWSGILKVEFVGEFIRLPDCTMRAVGSSERRPTRKPAACR